MGAFEYCDVCRRPILPFSGGWHIWHCRAGDPLELVLDEFRRAKKAGAELDIAKRSAALAQGDKP